MNVKPSEIRTAAKDYRQADVHDEMLMACGYGDGGGGVTEAMCERARRVNDLAGTPQSSWGRIDAYFKGLEETRDLLPAYKGELYLQYHRGVLTTHGRLKKAFREAERALQIWEAASCVTKTGPIDIDAWRRVVFAQFHDYIPGSSIPEVYDEAIPELQNIASRGLKETDSLLSEEGKVALFNPLPYSRTTIYKGKCLKLPPLSGRHLSELQTVEAAPVVATANTLSNGRVTAAFSKHGTIVSLSIDDREIAINKPLGELTVYPDQPHAFEAWDIDRSTLSQPKPALAAERTEQSCDGTIGMIRYKLKITKNSVATITYSLKQSSCALEVSYDIDWQDTEHLLKVLFPTDYNGSHARFGDPFGSTLRSQQPGKAYDEAQWEVAGNRWAMVCDDGEQDGLWVATESKYGWSCRSGLLSLSLLRSAKLPSHPNQVAQPPRTRERTYSDLGQQEIKIAIGRYNPLSPREEMPAAQADQLFNPPIAYTGSLLDCGLVGIHGGDSVIPVWAKPEADGSWVLRLHETLGRRGKFKLQLDEGYSAELVSLMGEAKKEPQDERGWPFRPYQILSFRISSRK